MELQEAFDAGFDAVKAYVDRSFEAFERRILFLEKRIDSLPTPKDGKDADMSEVRAIIVEEMQRLDVWTKAETPDLPDIENLIESALATKLDAIASAASAKIPAPQDGKSVAVEDVLPAIEASIADKVAAIPPAKDGSSVTLEDVLPMIAAEVEKRVSTLPAPKDGEPGKDADPAVIREMVQEAIANLPPAKDGIDVDMTLVESKLDKAISEAQVKIADVLAAIPFPKDGRSVTVADVAPMIEETIRKAVDAIPRPADGKDGINAVDCLIDKDQHLVFTFSDGRVKDVGRVVGWDGADVDMEDVADRVRAMFDAIPKPKDGVDGLGFDDLALSYDGEKTVTLTFRKGDTFKELNMVMPIVIDRGVFKESSTYDAGDGVTWAGSFWIAQENTSEKPDSGKGWRLAVKRGRDGKDADGKPTKSVSAKEPA